MDIKSEGAGYCGRCHSPLMTLAGRGAICLGCEEAGKPKTGRTVVVTGEQGNGLEGPVMGHEVPHMVGPDSPAVSQPHIENRLRASDSIHLEFTLADLESPSILLTIMQALYDGIDNLPPPATLKETKKAIAIQGVIEKQIKKLKGE